MNVVLWGTYDLGKPRNRLILKGLRENGVEVVECHASIWENVRDKAALKGFRNKLGRLLLWGAAYPRLIYRYFRLPPHDVVVVGYLGLFDVLVLWPFAKLRGVPVVWDAFLSLYDTVVSDRGMAGSNGPLGRLLWGLEWLACRAADRVTLDTAAHAGYFQRTFGLQASRLGSFFVGAEDNFHISERPSVRDPAQPFTVLFYGQFIPLHGIDTIIEAANLTRDEDIRWVIIGTGQEEARIRQMLAERPLPRVERISWVPYDELRDRIVRADVCLGIFGGSEKSANVIPNKAFQILAAGGRLVTMDSPAIRELVDERTPGVHLVPPGDPAALAETVRNLRHDVIDNRDAPYPPAELRAAVRSRAVTTPLVDVLTRLVNGEVPEKVYAAKRDAEADP